MSTDHDLDRAFLEGRRHAVHMPFVVDDAVELASGPDEGLRGPVIAAFLEDDGLAYTVALCTGRDAQVPADGIRLIEP